MARTEEGCDRGRVRVQFVDQKKVMISWSRHEEFRVCGGKVVIPYNLNRRVRSHTRGVD